MSRLTEKKIIDIFQSTLNDKFVSEDVEYFKIGKKYFVFKNRHIGRKYRHAKECRTTIYCKKKYYFLYK